MSSTTNLRSISCGTWSGHPIRTASVYRTLSARHPVGRLQREGAGPARVQLDGVGEFTASMTHEGTVCEIRDANSQDPSLWGSFPSSRPSSGLITDSWQHCALGGRTLAVRRESVPILATAIVIADSTDASGSKVYLGLQGEGVLLYPLLYWPLLIPLAWRERLPACIYDPRLVIGLERPCPADDAIVLRAAVVCLALLATELADSLEHQPQH
jgi:hypothetical protein